MHFDPPSRCRCRAASILALLLVLAAPVFGQGQPSGSFGPLALGEVREGVLAPASAESLVYHTYTVEIPPGLAELIVAVDGLGSDLDLAFKFGGEIVAYDESDVDFLDVSEVPNPSASVASPPAGTLYIDVLNLIGQAASYRLSVTAPGAATAPVPPTTGDPFVDTFAGEGIVLTLTSAAGGYLGQLVFQGQTYPLTAQAQGATLQGSFTSQGQAFAFEAALSGDALQLRTGGTSYALSRQGGGQAATPQAPAPTAPATAAVPTGLEGKWVRQELSAFGSVVDQSLYLLPDGRYFYVESGDVPVQEEGRYRIDGARLELAPYCSAAYGADIALTGDQLSLTTVDLFGDPSTAAYTFEPGSEIGAVQEVAAVDAERSTFHARVPIGPVVPGATTPEPGLPADPDPQNVFAQATVFIEGELYTYVAEFTYVFDIFGTFQTVNAADIAFNPSKMANLNYSRGEYRDQALWRLYPNGRALLRYETYFDARDLTTDPVTPNIVASWGRYRVEGEQLLFESDAGDPTTVELINGRRQLDTGGICFGEVQWSTEELERQTRELQ